jgi:hypothetical protein
MASTLTLQSFLNFCSTHADLLPLANVGGYINEPGLSLCNDALSDLISDPNDWKFNRVEMPFFITTPNVQDYIFAGATIFALNQTNPTPTPNWVSQGWGIQVGGISVSNGVVTVQTYQPHRIAVNSSVFMSGVVMTTGLSAAYNSVFTDNGTTSGWGAAGAWGLGWGSGYGSMPWLVTATTNNSISFASTTGQIDGDAGGAPGINDFGYGTSASMQEVNNTSSPPNQMPLTYRRELPIISRVAMPEKVSVLADNGDGSVKIRMHMVPGATTYAVNIVYQAKAPLKTSLTQTFSPFPDNYAAVIRQSLLHRMYRYLNDPKTDSEYKKLQAEIAKIQAADDAEATDIGLQPEEPLMDNSYWGWW